MGDAAAEERQTAWSKIRAEVQVEQVFMDSRFSCDGGFNGFLRTRLSLSHTDVQENYSRHCVVCPLKLFGLALNFREKVRNLIESPHPLDKFLATRLCLGRNYRSSKVDVQGLYAFCIRPRNAL